MADVGIRPLDLPEASAVAETDKIMVTNTAGATKVATAETLFKNSSKTICLTRAEYNALTEKKQDTMYVITDESVSGVTVDQTFNGSSANPQSGVAINGALTDYEQYTSYEWKLYRQGKMVCITYGVEKTFTVATTFDLDGEIPEKLRKRFSPAIYIPAQAITTSGQFETVLVGLITNGSKIRVYSHNLAIKELYFSFTYFIA